MFDLCAVIFFSILGAYLPGTPKTSDEYYIECVFVRK